MSLKTMFALMSLSLIMTMVSAQTSVPVSLATMETPAVTTVDWSESLHDFGAVTKGAPVSHRFLVENTGDRPLEIQDVKASCGCTATDYSSEPIAPGASGYVLATYQAKSVGFFNKSVTVKLNTTEGTVLLRLKGQVVAPAPGE